MAHRRSSPGPGPSPSPTLLGLALALAVLGCGGAVGANTCVPLASAGDCAEQGQFTCTLPESDRSGAAGAHYFGFCTRNGTAWSCCEDPEERERPPAPVRPIPTYPLPPAKPRSARPNIIFVITDDQDRRLGSVDVMNKTKGLLANGGTTLTQFYVSVPICCPSRISYLSGRYAHNSGAVSGTPPGWCAVGKYWKAPMQHLSFPNYLQKAGYTTGIFGKELNVNDDTYVSPGWDRFFALGGSSEGHFYANWFNDDGHRYQAAPDEYMTDLIKTEALRFIQENIEKGKNASSPSPFFAYIAPHAPHTRATPAPGTDGYFWDWQSPRLPSWNHASPDKHWMMRTQQEMTPKCINSSDSLYQNRLRSLLGVDDLVGDIADTLIQGKVLDNTYIIYTSDHGFKLGEYRQPYFKAQPYDTDINVPFMIRGPGIPAGKVITDMIGMNIDIAPTIAQLAGTSSPPEALVDGMSMVPWLVSAGSTSAEQAAVRAGWRTDFLFEFYGGGGASCPSGPYCHHIISCGNNTYQGVRTVDGDKFVKFVDDEQFEELYSTGSDPYELHNLAKDPAHAQLRTRLAARLAVLSNCSQAGCH